MTALLHTEARNVLNLLLLHISTHRACVLAGVKIVAGIKKTISVDSEEEIVRRYPRLQDNVSLFLYQTRASVSVAIAPVLGSS